MIERSPHVLVRVACAPFESLRPFEGGAVARALDRLESVEATWNEARTGLEERLFDLAGPPVENPERARARFALLALRREVHAGHAPAALDPTALGANLVRRWKESSEARARARAEAADAIAADEERARRGLVERLSDPLLREGLRLVGRSLAARAERLRRREPATWRASDRQAAATVLEYAVRMATKTSPHGVFCATAVGTWGAAARAAGTARPARVVARLNVAEARRIAAPLLRELPLPGASSRLNPTLLREGDAWTWWRGAAADDPEALERRTRVAANPLLDALVRRIENVDSAIDRRHVVDWASRQTGQDASGWVERLHAAGLLVDHDGISHLEPRPLRLLAKLANLPGAGAPAWVPRIEAIESGLDAIEQASDSEGRMCAGDDVRAAVAALSAVRPAAAAARDEDALVRLDSASDLEVVLPQSVGEEIDRLLPRYARLFAALYPASVRLAPYRARFLARHPADREVSLAALFHGVFDDLGGFARSSYPDPARMAPGEDDPELRLAGEAHQRFRQFFAERVAGAGDELRISDDDWDFLAGSAAPPAFSCGLLFQVLPDGRVVWNGLFGPGLAVSRLAELHPALASAASEGQAALLPPGGVAAEIPYAHAGRTANAGLRPSVFSAEIELPGETPSDGVRTFPLRDLAVRYDSSSRRFALRSRHGDVPVVPVLTSGLSPEGFISFLVALGQQDAPPLALFPDVDDARIGAMPRIVSGHTILFRRRWSFSAEETGAMLAGGDRLDRLDRLRRLRRRARASSLPPRVFASSGASPKPRYVHLEAATFLPMLEELAGDGTPLVLREMLPAPEDAWFRDSDGGHAIEFLVQVRSAGAAAGR